jgi:uncharacterized membrane protein
MRDSFQRMRDTYGRICVIVMGGISAIQVLILIKAAGAPLSMNGAFGTIFGLMLAGVGNWLGKVRRNFWCGIRTPWTLANDTVWERTHRWGARIMVVYGLVIAVSALLLPPIGFFAVALGGGVLLVAWCLAYSYWEYRRVGQVDQMH